VPTSTTCPLELFSEAGRATNLSIKVEAGVKGLLKVQEKPGPERAVTLPFTEFPPSIPA